MVKYALFILLAGCLAKEETQAREDAFVGKKQQDGWSVDVADGLASIRTIDDVSVELRATCSSFDVTFGSDGAESIGLFLSNIGPNIVLTFEPEDAFELVSREGLRVQGIVHFAGAKVTMHAADPRPGPFEFLAFGDIQLGIDHFGDMISRVNEETEADFILMLGDLTNDAQPAEFDAIEDAFSQIQLPIYAVPGNHDLHHPNIYRERFGRGSYSCVHRGTRLTGLDSSNAELAVSTWPMLEKWLNAGAKSPHVIFSHIPTTEASPARSGQWNSRREARYLQARAAEEKVDLFLFGHIHSFDAYALAGIPAFISGGCGALPERLDGVGRHYLRIDSKGDGFATTKVDIFPE